MMCFEKMVVGEFYYVVGRCKTKKLNFHCNNPKNAINAIKKAFENIALEARKISVGLQCKIVVQNRIFVSSLQTHLFYIRLQSLSNAILLPDC